MTWSFFLPLIKFVLGKLLDTFTDDVRDALHKAIRDVYEKAKETDNPLDDMGVEFIGEMFGLDLKER